MRGLSTIAARDRNAPGQPRSRIGELTAEVRGLLRAAITRAGVIVLAAAALPALASFVIMAIEFQHWYGSPKWTITTGTGAGLSGGGGNTWYPLVFGGIFGTDFGWVPWAPIGVLALAATGCLLLEAPRWVTYALLVIAVYQLELAISGLPSPGFVFAGRYEIICLPLFSVALMVALARVPVTWLAFIPLMLATIAISWQASERADANLLNTGAVGLANAARLTSAFPDVEADPVAPQSFTAAPASLAGTVGRLARDGKVRRARPADGMGYLAAGPRIGLTPGVYDGHFTVAQTGGQRAPAARRAPDLRARAQHRARIEGVLGGGSPGRQADEGRLPVHDPRRAGDRDARVRHRPRDGRRGRDERHAGRAGAAARPRPLPGRRADGRVGRRHRSSSPLCSPTPRT